MEIFREELNEELAHVKRKPVPDNESARTKYMEQVHPGYAYHPYGPHPAPYYGHPKHPYAGYPVHPNGYFAGIAPPRRATSPQPRLSKAGGPIKGSGVKPYHQ